MSIEKRFMKAEDWEEEKVTRVPHLNNVCIPSGYNRIDGICGNPLLPACIFEDKLYKTLNDLRIKYSDLFLKRLFVKMPYWNRKDSCIPDNYEFLDKEARLVSTAVTVVMIPKNKVCIKGTKLEYAYRKNDLLSLSERLKTEGQNFSSLVGNLGYYMTENLIEGILPWTHNTRYCEKFHLKTIKSYLGFYYYSKNEKINSTFMGAHKACVAINKNGNIEVIPKLCIEEYQVKLNDKCFTVKSINPKEIEDKVAVFTPAYRKDGDVEYLYKLDEYAPEIPILDGDTNRINLFVANEGEDGMPVEIIVKVWKGRAPIPSFGAVISFEKKYYNELFGDLDILNTDIEILPLSGNINFSNYSQILGGFVPLIANNNHLYDSKNVEELMSAMDLYGNALSPLAQAGRETRNFDPYIREPAGIFVETENKIGWILFDGRHELTIGSSVADVAKITKKIEESNLIDEKIDNAVFIDGGSAMKAYVVEIVKEIEIETDCEYNDTDIGKLKLNLLNRAAAGARNGPGEDTEGLNFYSTLRIGLS